MATPLKKWKCKECGKEGTHPAYYARNVRPPYPVSERVCDDCKDDNE